MLWFLIWATLVIGTLVGAFFLGRDLWRKGRALADELERGAHLFGELAERMDSLTADAADEAMRTRRDPFADPVRARATLAAARERREVRRDAREERHLRTFERWKGFSR